LGQLKKSPLYEDNNVYGYIFENGEAYCDLVSEDVKFTEVLPPVTDENIAFAITADMADNIATAETSRTLPYGHRNMRYRLVRWNIEYIKMALLALHL